MEQAPAVDPTGRECPTCAHVRTSADTGPPGRCPRCHCPYEKLRKPLAAHRREMAAEARSDPSLYVLIAVNLIVLAIAYGNTASVRGLMLVYWMQSVIIGICAAIRIRTLGHSPWVFAFHYGWFHFVYFFILVGDHKGAAPLASPLLYLLSGVVFAVNHSYSLRRNLAKDAAGSPDPWDLALLPYARIVPMHIVMCTGLFVAPGTKGLLLFGLRKIVADAVMHIVEHHALKPKAE